MGHMQLADPAALGLSHAALGSAVLGLWVEQLASAPDALPPEVSGVGPQFTGPQVSAWAANPALAVQGRRGEGHQGPPLLPEFSN